MSSFVAKRALLMSGRRRSSARSALTPLLQLGPVFSGWQVVDGAQLGSHEREAIKWPIGLAICEADPVRAVALRVLLALVWPDARSVLPLGVLDRDVRPDRTTRA